MEASRKREEKVCAWLDEIKKDASHIFLLGDLWDTWLEYKKVIPKGSVRFLGKLASLSDAGIKITIYSGNHDLWTRDFFQTELGVELRHIHETISINGQLIHLGHGDGIGPGDHRYKFLKAILRNPICQFFYRQVHPDLGIRIASFFSRRGPKHKYENLEFMGEEKEFQMLYAKEILEEEDVKYFVFGHRHIPNFLPIGDAATYVNLGDWLSYNTYAVWSDGTMELKKA